MRISKVVTKTGDLGTTSVHSSKRISKGSALIMAIGKVDSLNAQLGMLLALVARRPKCKATHVLLCDVQNTLFDLGGTLAMGYGGLLDAADIGALEEATAVLLDDLEPLKEFVMPRGEPIVCQAHICRTVCREAEALVVAAKDDGQNVGNSIVYLNRLSDYLFCLARSLSDRHTSEVLWQHRLALSTSE